MSTPPSIHRRPAPDPHFSGLPLWSAFAILIAALVTGLLVSLATGGLGLTFLVCFAVASLLMTLLVDPRGIFLTVASLPLLFGLGTVLTAWSVGRVQASDGAPLFSRATVVTALYPLTEHFPWMAVVTLVAVVIGVARLWLLRRRRAELERQAIESRRRTAEADRRNRTLSSSARKRADQITVEELLSRNRNAGDSIPIRRPRRSEREQ